MTLHEISLGEQPHEYVVPSETAGGKVYRVYTYLDPEASSWSPSGGAAAVPALKFNPGKPTITDDPIYADPGGRTDPPDDQPLGAGSEATRVRQPVSANGST